ncbi:MAG: recombination protein NinG, partial [Parcubacteria group bacterium]
MNKPVELDANTIQRYRKFSVPILIKKATRHFNAFIRDRDSRQPCIACGAWTYLQAGHFYSAGKYPRLRFNENNCLGECVPCNYFLSGNLLKYREGLIGRIGLEAVNELDRLS